MSRILSEKLTVTQLVRKFLAFYGNRRFITVSTTADSTPVMLTIFKFIIVYFLLIPENLRLKYTEI